MISLAHINYCFIGCKDKQKTRNRQRFYDFRHVLIEKYHELVVLGHELVEMSLPKMADSVR